MTVKIKKGLLGELDVLHQRMERMMELVLHRHGHSGSAAQPDWCPAADLYETEDEVVIVLEVSGVDPATLDVTLEATVLRVLGRRPEIAPRGSCVALHQMEIEYGSFERLFTVPPKIEGDSAQARLENGFLEIRIPKTGKPGEATERVEISTSE